MAIQLPLPKHIDEANVLMYVDPDKDVDVCHPLNFATIALEMESCISATLFGILEPFPSAH